MATPTINLQLEALEALIVSINVKLAAIKDVIDDIAAELPESEA